MTINRVEGVPFAQIANDALRDKRLSFRARGILAMVLSHSGEWEAPRRWLIEQGTEGRDAVQSALNELTEFGYREVRNERTNTGIRTVVVWHQVPHQSDSWRSGSPTGTISDRRETGPTSEDHIPEDHIPEHHQEITLITANAYVSNTDQFARFWDLYPRRVGKQAAAKAFYKAIKEGHKAEVIMDGLRRFVEDPNIPDTQYIPHPATWLNQGRWMDDPFPTRVDRTKAGTATDKFRELAAHYAEGQ